MGKDSHQQIQHMLRHLPDIAAYVTHRRNALLAPPTPSLVEPYKPRHRWPSDRTGKAAVQLTYDLTYQASAALLEAINDLTEQEQKLIQMRFVRGQSLKAVAKELKVTTDEVCFLAEDLLGRLDRAIAHRVRAAKRVAPKPVAEAEAEQDGTYQGAGVEQAKAEQAAV